MCKSARAWIWVSCWALYRRDWVVYLLVLSPSMCKHFLAGMIFIFIETLNEPWLICQLLLSFNLLRLEMQQTMTSTRKKIPYVITDKTKLEWADYAALWKSKVRFDFWWQVFQLLQGRVTSSCIHLILCPNLIQRAKIVWSYLVSQCFLYFFFCSLSTVSKSDSKRQNSLKFTWFLNVSFYFCKPSG